MNGWRVPSMPYGPGKEHRWGPETATINWCEEDYVITAYCAELINSITNVMFIYLSLRGMWNCFREGHDKVFLVTWSSLCLVGIGSFLFHTTLWYSMQLVDELSMINTTLIMWFATFSFGRSRIFSWILGIGLLCVMATIASVYHYLGNPVFHQNAYGILTAIVLGRSWYIVETRVKPGHPQDYRDMRLLFAMGFSCVATAFALWNLDNAFCMTLIRWRRTIGIPWGFFLEGHGHWHLLSGLAAYYFIVYGVYLRHCLQSHQAIYELVWPSVFALPDVRRRRSASSVTTGDEATKKNL